ncbi:hypothetical protein EVAR_7756_1 [Eumeta japonica]|uniref:Uncharacterized protein n=1 Tax=Eumeta variegata TaxID=151549 RepID=A0A4C1TJ06_EUMVA|nr:hypothetical protein EVAR_7756_1 [Eumeta japonica]
MAAVHLFGSALFFFSAKPRGIIYYTCSDRRGIGRTLQLDRVHLDVPNVTQIRPIGMVRVAFGSVKQSRWIVLRNRPLGIALLTVVIRETVHIRTSSSTHDLNITRHFFRSQEPNVEADNTPMARAVSDKPPHVFGLLRPGVPNYADPNRCIAALISLPYFG